VVARDGGIPLNNQEVTRMKKLLASSMTLAVIASLAFAGDARAYFPTGENPDGNGGGCSSGRVKCGESVKWTCLEYVSTSGGITLAPNGGGANVAWTCKSYQQTTVYLWMP
jgi:hypothetical protein